MWYRYCKGFVGEFVAPKIEHTAIMYGAEEVSKYGSNIIFTQGKTDPWRWVGINENKYENPNIAVEVIGCNDCGHCRELYTPVDTDPKEVKDAREKIKSIFKFWLKK